MKNKFILLLALMLSSCTPTNIALPQKESKSTVLIHVKIQKDEKQGWGTCSGVYVDKNEILTASHCVGAYEEDIKVKEIWVGNVDGKSAKARIELLSPERDLCLLHTDLDGIPVLLANSVRQGQVVAALGMPLGLKWIYTTGVVSQINFRMEPNPTKHFILSAVVLPGNSGGPIFDEDGYLVGILVRSTSMLGPYGASGLGIAVDIHEVKGFLGRD